RLFFRHERCLLPLCWRRFPGRFEPRALLHRGCRGEDERRPLMSRSRQRRKQSVKSRRQQAEPREARVMEEIKNRRYLAFFGAIRFFGQRARGAEAEPDDSRLEVVSHTPVAFGGSLVLVRFEGRRILLGVTRGQWTALADLGRAPSGSNPEAASVIDAELSR